MKQKFWLGLLLTLSVAIGGATQTAKAQDKTLFWDRYDVNLIVQPNSDILVEEVQKIEFTSGTFRFGFAAIPLDRLEQITEVSVSEIIDGVERAYTPNSAGEYGFTTFTNDSNELEITWYFPPTSNSRHTYILRYRVSGGLRFYDEGDQLWWKAIAPDHNFRIRSSRITVTLPQTFAQEQLKIAAYGAPINNSYVSGNQVVFEAQAIPADEEVEVRVQFPHGVVQGSPSDWQAAFDRRQQWGPVVGVLSAALGMILLVGGPVGLYLLWYTRGRDLPAELIPEYITEPPSDLPAAVVGTLIDERAEMKDIIAGILDLARRGALRIEEQRKEGFLGIGSGLDHIFYLEDADQAVYPHEKRLLKRIFGQSHVRRLRDLRNKFYTAVPALSRDLYDQVVKAGFFRSSPESTRQKWGCLGIAGAIASLALTVALLAILADYSALVACPGVALGVTMLSLIVVSRYMPRKTPQGVEEAAKWLAFKRYLETIDQHGDLEAVKEKFEQFLPYAMAFGLERRLINKFAAIGTPAPRWWGPVVGPGHYGYPYGYGRPRPAAERPAGGPPGPLADAGGQMPSLAGMSEGIGTSLAGMSDSLGSMLSSASSTFTSRPAPKSSGGGGWSGGGFGGGGGGGGGSRGFG